MNKRTTHFILSAVLFLLSLGGCEKDVIRGEQEECSLLLNLRSDFTYSIGTRSNPADSLFATPELNDFRVQILNPSGKILKEWESYADIPQPIKIQTGTFTIKALAGEFHSGAFDQPSFEGAATVGIKKDEPTEVDLICKLATTIATADYTEGFKHTFKDYRTEMSTTGEAVVFYKEEKRVAFFEPGTLSVKIHLTKQDGTSFSFSAAQIDSTCAGEYYRFKFDVTDENGGSTLLVSFNDSTRENPIPIDLNQDWLPGDAPFCTLTGFISGQSFENLEGEGVASELSALITARSRIKSCKLKTTSDLLIQKGWPAKEIELTNATEQVRQQLRALGLKWTEKLTGLNMARIDFSEVIPLLPVGEHIESHSFTLEVTDQQDQTLQQPIVLNVKTSTPAFILNAHEDTWVKTTELNLNLDLQKGHIEEINLQYYNSQHNNWENLTYEINGNTGNLYNLKAQINFHSPLAQLRAVYGKSPRTSAIHFKVLNPEFNIALTELPWAKHVVLEAQQTNGNLLATNSRPEEFRVQVLENGTSEWKDVDFEPIEGHPTQLYVKGLTAGTQQKIKVIYNAGIGDQESANQEEFTTENTLQLPNPGFEEWSESTITDVSQGGRRVSTNFIGLKTWSDAPKIAITVNEPLLSWATINASTANPASTPLNTWFVIPSTTKSGDKNTGNFAACLKNVAWNDNGVSVPDNTSVWNSSPGTPNAPSNFKRSAGKLFLGKYENHIEKEGIPFVSRPTSMRFYYKYKATPNTNDRGLVRIQIKAQDGSVLFSQTESLESKEEYTFHEIHFTTYTDLNKQASSLLLLFASSDENIPIETSNNMSDFISTGSELYIDDIELVYE